MTKHQRITKHPSSKYAPGHSSAAPGHEGLLSGLLYKNLLLSREITRQSTVGRGWRKQTAWVLPHLTTWIPVKAQFDSAERSAWLRVCEW
jgi:hypothetical protein